MRGTFKFYKTPESKWYIDIPGWDPADIDALQMVLGADTMLDKVSGNTNACYLDISDQPFDGADEIKLIENLKDSVGGGNYLMKRFKGESVQQEMWLCEVTEYVFGYLPEVIYVDVRLQLP
ncbi:hypothetical protein SAMN05444266_107130 [Chitinophaga jiangningensis]|uniref:Uncharacterized protein n=1 Tax=Chitinophaga jiangningensis TaxID=1419482 RepID=A0A1M7H939_9BACT|nr:DUF6717 family protein [Chitinophaga jiangningensis]SHM24928.1 hypothetical protein SAMN05444266_107130 [Chitinophaga jiangningensis]